jgi:hypothetical protein
MADEKQRGTTSATGEHAASRESSEIKVTDKRMFNAAGELREEYRFLDDKGKASAEPEKKASPPPEPPRSERLERPADPVRPIPLEADRGATIEIPGTPPGLGPSFLDLLAMLAEPVSIYLGDIELPDGGTAENLEMARLHIDLLDILRQKTRGNLTAQESGFLEDLLYRLRMRYVQKRG